MINVTINNDVIIHLLTVVILLICINYLGEVESQNTYLPHYPYTIGTSPPKSKRVKSMPQLQH